jgi:hypothetical protein
MKANRISAVIAAACLGLQLALMSGGSAVPIVLLLAGAALMVATCVLAGRQ